MVADALVLQTSAGVQPSVASIDRTALDEAVKAYLTKGAGPERQLALRYWIASNYASIQRQRQAGLTRDEVAARATERTALIDQVLAAAAPTISQN